MNTASKINQLKRQVADRSAVANIPATPAPALPSRKVSVAEDQARHTFRKINALVVAFVRELGGWDNVPAGFDITSAGWHEAEAKIDAAIARHDAAATVDACLEYEQRAERYLNAWRQMNQKAA